MRKLAARFLMLVLIATAFTFGLLVPATEQTATAVPFCELVEPGYPCEDLCYCTSPHGAVVPAYCCESSAFICS